MNKINKRIFLTLMAILFLVVLVQYLPQENSSEKVKIGAADDSSGIVIDYMIRNKGLKNADVQGDVEPYFIKDC